MSYESQYFAVDEVFCKFMHASTSEVERQVL